MRFCGEVCWSTRVIQSFRAFLNILSRCPQRMPGTPRSLIKYWIPGLRPRKTKGAASRLKSRKRVSRLFPSSSAHAGDPGLFMISGSPVFDRGKREVLDLQLKSRKRILHLFLSPSSSARGSRKTKGAASRLTSRKT